MSKGSRLAFVCAVALAAVPYWVARFSDDGSAAPVILNYRQPIPSVSRDGPVGPTPTPPPASSQLDVVVRLEMTVMELSVVAGGTTPITIKAEARTTNPVTRADVFATAHPQDALTKCDWRTVYAHQKVGIIILNWDGIFTPALRLAFDQPPAERSAWHFDVTCYPESPAPPQHLRWPGSGDRSVGEWLALLGLGTNGIVVETPDYNGSPGCIKRQGSVQHSHPVFGTATITVFVVAPGCIVPPPPPIQLPPSVPGSGQNPNYDPGGI